MQAIAYSYVRFSSKGKQSKGSSVYRQTHDTVGGESPQSWCARQKPPVLFDTSLTFRDLGKSAYSGQAQEELYAFLELVKRGRIRPGSFLLVEKIDRVSRKGVDEGYELCKKILKAGVSIVSLARGKVYGPEAVKGLMKGALELQIELEQAHEYSKTLSDRVGAAWELKRKKARQGTLATAAMPPWLAPAGEGDDRRAVVVPEKAATMRRVYDMVLAGHGLTRIVKTLEEDGTKPITRRRVWSKSSLRRLLADRAALGEHQPMKGRGKARVKDGLPIEGYFPAITQPATFAKVQASLGSRKNHNVGRHSRLLNVFSGLLKDARTSATYITGLRIEKGDRRHYVLQSASKTGGSNSFPFAVFERAALACLAEVNVKELLPPTDEPDEVLSLSGELGAVEADIKAISADLDEHGESPTLYRRLRAKEARQKELAGLLAEASLRAANPAAESWGECKGLLAVLDADPEGARMRLRPVLRRLVESIQLLVFARGTCRFVIVQMWFKDSREGQHRDYLVVHQPPIANAKARKEGWWRAWSFKPPAGCGRDLCEKPADLPEALDGWSEWFMAFLGKGVTHAGSVEPLPGEARSRLMEALKATAGYRPRCLS
jgi:DNA invertase Pin-like site-specific DNA recombinase